MSKHVASMIGLDMIERIDRVRAAVDRLGFRMGTTPYPAAADIDTITLYPKDNCLPVYSRDAALFTGTLLDLERWLAGLDWARQYDSYLGAMSDKRREQYEVKEVARQERIKYKKAKAETFKILKQENS